MKLSFIIFVLGYVAVYALEPINQSSMFFDFSSSSNKDAEYCEENGAGVSCKGCNASIYCFKLPSEDWIYNETPCGQGESCHSDFGICVDDNDNPFCQTFPEYEFTCYQLGLFPHPYDCLTYYSCKLNSSDQVSPFADQFKCDNGYGYDPLTTRCTKPLTHGNCPPITIRECRNFGDHHPISGNPYMYSVCLNTEIENESVLVPHIFYCGPEEKFMYTSCQKALAEFASFQPGEICHDEAMYADSTDCSRYIYCGGDGHPPQYIQCPSGQKFDRWLNGCNSLSCLLT